MVLPAAADTVTSKHYANIRGRRLSTSCQRGTITSMRMLQHNAQAHAPSCIATSSCTKHQVGGRQSGEQRDGWPGPERNTHNNGPSAAASRKLQRATCKPSHGSAITTSTCPGAWRGRCGESSTCSHGGKNGDSIILCGMDRSTSNGKSQAAQQATGNRLIVS